MFYLSLKTNTINHLFFYLQVIIVNLVTTCLRKSAPFVNIHMILSIRTHSLTHSLQSAWCQIVQTVPLSCCQVAKFLVIVCANKSINNVGSGSAKRKGRREREREGSRLASKYSHSHLALAVPVFHYK